MQFSASRGSMLEKVHIAFSTRLTGTEKLKYSKQKSDTSRLHKCNIRQSIWYNTQKEHVKRVMSSIWKFSMQNTHPLNNFSIMRVKGEIFYFFLAANSTSTHVFIPQQMAVFAPTCINLQKQNVHGFSVSAREQIQLTFQLCPNSESPQHHERHQC